MTHQNGWIARSVGAVRDTWLIVGISLALLLGIEGLYRGQSWLRDRLHEATSSAVAQDPYAGQPWLAQFNAEQAESLNHLAWRPFVYMRREPFAGRYVTVDSLGLRRTANSAPATAVRREVFFFGGSTMWGTGQRDSLTIPSQAAADLAAAGLRDASITNFGQSGYVFTQEVLELTMQLRAGARPAAVVFYDGINDVGSAVTAGKAGIPANDINRARDFTTGRQLFTWHTDLAAEARTAGRLALIGAERLRFVNRLRPPPRPLASPPDDSLADDIAHTYLTTIDLVEALAKHYGFVALYVWQPSLQATPKPLSPFEQQLRKTLEADAYSATLIRVHTLLPRRVAVAAVATPGRFADLSGMFAGDTTTVFLDDIGHTTEAAAGQIAQRITEMLLHALPASESRNQNIPARSVSRTTTSQ